MLPLARTRTERGDQVPLDAAPRPPRYPGGWRISPNQGTASPPTRAVTGPRRASMVHDDRPAVKLQDLNVGLLAQLSWEELTPEQWRERMEDMHWMLDMLYCARVL